MAVANNATLVRTAWPNTANSIAWAIFFAIIGSLLLTVAAKVKVPFYPVPMTMQAFAIVAIGLALGGRLAFATVCLYLAQGAAGLPVFTGTPEQGIGLAYMFGPTGGYLAAYPFAAAAIGLLADKGWSRHLVLSVVAGLVGIGLIYLGGVAWLANLIGFEKAMAVGFWPFIVKDIVGTAAAALAVAAGWRLIKQ